MGVDQRGILNASRYMARSAGGWRLLPPHFPPWQTVQWWFRLMESAAFLAFIAEIVRRSGRCSPETTGCGRPGATRNMIQRRPPKNRILTGTAPR
jgi:transposase